MSLPCVNPASAGARGVHVKPLLRTPRGAGKPLKAIWGPLTMPDGTSALPVYQGLGVQVLQLTVQWNEVAPTRPLDPTDPSDLAYRWPAALDAAVAQAPRYGLRIALRVLGFPAWSNGGRDPSWMPADPLEYARFLQAASRRYPSVHQWMILNEVNSSENFQPAPSGSPLAPQNYARLLDDAYGALKAVARSNLVIGGMTYSAGDISTRDFIRGLRLPWGRPPRMDYYGYDPYSLRYPDLAHRQTAPRIYEINDLAALERQLRSVYGERTPKLWLAEFGISTSSNSSFDYYVAPTIQARWVSAAFRLVDSLPFVAALGWYELLDQPGPTGVALTEGLMSAQGQPKPSFAAYAAAP